MRCTATEDRPGSTTTSRRLSTSQVLFWELQSALFFSFILSTVSKSQDFAKSDDFSLFGGARAMSAFLSGEMKDTVEINPMASYLLEKLFSRKERAELFRGWAGSASMWLKVRDSFS